MKVMGNALLLALVISALTFSHMVWSNESELLNRIERLERIVNSKGLVSLLSRIEQNENEIRKMYGGAEIFNHKLDEIQERYSTLYLDVKKLTTIDTLCGSRGINRNPEISFITGQKLTIKKTVHRPVMINEVIESNVITTLTPLAQPKKISNMNISVPVDNGKVAYQSAFQMLRNGKYKEAAEAFADFSKQYPDSSYLPNAFYWQGETNYVLRNFDLAIVAFQIVIDRFTTSNKVADAMLKQGFSQYELGQVSMAKKILVKVMRIYPNTSVSNLAKARLNRIRRQMH